MRLKQPCAALNGRHAERRHPRNGPKLASATQLGLAIGFQRSDAEEEIIRAIHEARGSAAGVLINRTVCIKTSVAIMNALKTFMGPVIEVHQGEGLRHHALVSLAATVVAAGFGTNGAALRPLAHGGSR